MSKILHLAADANFHLYRKPVKMSYSFDRLAAIIRTELNTDIIGGDVFIFLNKQRTTIKIMVYEYKGFSIFYRRLDEGSFQLPLIDILNIIIYEFFRVIHIANTLNKKNI